MDFQVGDKVIHWAYGIGEIVNIEEKIIQDQPTNCYVVKASTLMIWIPVDTQQQRSLRLPTPRGEFDRVFAALQEPGERLIDDRVLRKTQLMAKLNDGLLLSICQVVRDLTHYKRANKLNDNEKSILERATNSLLAEWAYSLGVPVNEAQEAMAGMLNPAPVIQ